MSRIALELGPLKIYWYSLFIFLGLLAGIITAIREAKKYNISEDFIYDLAFFTFPFALIGARLYYVIFNFDLYKDNLLSNLYIWEGGLAIHGARLFAFIFGIYYCKKHNVNIPRILDIAAPSIILAQAIGRWGNFFNQEAYGIVVSRTFLESLLIPDFIIEGMFIGGNYHHPTFLYESLFNLIGFFVLINFRKRNKTKLGETILLYLIWYSVGRFFIEGFRTDSLMLFDIKVAQLVSLLIIVFQ